MQQPVEGTLKVSACAQPDTAPESLSYSALILGVLTAPGIGPLDVQHDCTVPAKRCPQSGQSVPVTVDRTDPRRMVIHWERVPLRPRIGVRRR